MTFIKNKELRLNPPPSNLPSQNCFSLEVGYTMDSEQLFDDWQFLMFYTYAKNVQQIDAKINKKPSLSNKMTIF